MASIEEYRTTIARETTRIVGDSFLDLGEGCAWLPKINGQDGVARFSLVSFDPPAYAVTLERLDEPERPDDYALLADVLTQAPSPPAGQTT